VGPARPSCPRLIWSEDETELGTAVTRTRGLVPRPKPGAGILRCRSVHPRTPPSIGASLRTVTVMEAFDEAAAATPRRRRFPFGLDCKRGLLSIVARGAKQDGGDGDGAASPRAGLLL
jgi:hypothetical protein